MLSRCNWLRAAENLRPRMRVLPVASLVVLSHCSGDEPSEPAAASEPTSASEPTGARIIMEDAGLLTLESEGDKLRATVAFPDCVWGTCHIEREATCSLEVRNGQIAVRSHLAFTEARTSPCTFPCGRLAASCEVAAPPAGDYRVRWGKPLRTVELPTRETASFGGFGFNGAAYLHNCSGALIRFDGQPDDATALVLTNGHCVDWLEGEGALAHAPFAQAVTIVNSNEQWTEATATEVLYATMQGTDLAVLALDTTFAQLREQSAIEPLVVSKQRAAAGEPVTVASSYSLSEEQCAVESVVPRLLEDVFDWRDALRLGGGCDLRDGASGSPIVSLETGLVVGVANTRSNTRESPCVLDNPCEVHPDGRRESYPGVAYGQQINELYGCLGSDFSLDLELPSCALPRPLTSAETAP